MSLEELPPRARRIRFVCCWGVYMGGTTSACAENTPHTPLARCRNRNYLRVRGEYRLANPGGDPTGELPPRARRIRNLNKQRRRRDGTTSACAENTGDQGAWGASHGNYLRVRGEYDSLGVEWIIYTELPPRARRILLNIEHKTKLRGTTSACAENTIALVRGMAKIRNYLRVRGEYSRSQRHG